MIFLAIILVLGIIFFLVQCIKWHLEKETYGFGMFCGWAMATLVILEIICICESISKPSPTAIDVYQGKTTLEYTIREGVKVDSVVVFKENYHGKQN